MLPLKNEPSHLGTVEDVNGSSIGVKIADATPSGVLFVNGEAYRVGQVGGFVRIPCGYVDLYGVISQVGAGAAPASQVPQPLQGNRWLRVELVGQGRRGSTFERGIAQYPSIGDAVHVVTESDLQTIYTPGDLREYVDVGRIASAESIRAHVNLNKLIGRHSAVVGTTGSGKSSAVANLLHLVSDRGRFGASRVVLFDLHGEYTTAFGQRARVFRVGADAKLGQRELHVPFWALTFDELLAVSMGAVSGPPLSMIQERVLAGKNTSKPAGNGHKIDPRSITVDTPLPFSIHKLWYDLFVLQHATYSVSANQNQSERNRKYLLDENSQPLIGDAAQVVRPKFCALKDVKDDPDKIYKSAFGDLPRNHLEALETKLRDPRMQFLFNPGRWSVASDGSTAADLDELLDDWIGSDVPISVFDLSSIPVSVVDELVGSMLRVLYDAIYWGRERKEGGRYRPLLVGLEEAHLYLGTQGKGRAALAARRIAKEGRKYGVGMMLVSQRPAEIDPTILSQCGTFIALRLTNDADQSQVSSCASDNLKGLFSMLPVLRTGEALIVGEAVNIPTRSVLDRPMPHQRPNSDDPQAVVSLGKDGKPVRDGGWAVESTKEDYGPLVVDWRNQLRSKK